MIGSHFPEYVLRLRLLDVLKERLIDEHVAAGTFLILRSRSLRNGLSIIEGLTDVLRVHHAVVLKLDSARSRRLVQQTGDTLISVLKYILKPLALRIQVNVVSELHVLHVVEGARPNDRLLDLAQRLARLEDIGIVSRAGVDDGR